MGLERIMTKLIKFCIIGILIPLLGNSAFGAFVSNRYDTNSDATVVGLINAQATAAAQVNNLDIPTTGSKTNVGNLVITNGDGIHVRYGATVGTETETYIGNNGSIKYGGYQTLNPHDPAWQQLGNGGPFNSGNIGMAQDTQSGFALIDAGSGSAVLQLYEKHVFGGSATTNGDYPWGANWLTWDYQGRMIYNMPDATLTTR